MPLVLDGDTGIVGVLLTDANGNVTFDTNTLYVDAPNNKVGIGETSPQGKLHVKEGDAGSITTNVNHDTVIIEGSGNTGINIFSPNTSYQYLTFGDTENSNSGYIRYQHSNDQMVLRAGSSDTVYIKSSNVGIGDTNPTDKFTIKGDGARMTISSNDYEVAMLGRRGSTAPNWDRGYLRMKYDGANTIVLDTGGVSYLNGGNVGIGTTSPGSILDLRFSGRNGINVGSTNGAGSYIVLDGAGNGDASGGDYAYIEHKSDGNLEFNVGNGSNNTNTKMLIEPAGNVGIGMSDPAYKLDVGGIGATQLRLKSSGDTGYTQGAMIIESSASSNNPGNRGQGVYYYNVPNLRTWYTGTLYNNGNKFGFGYKQASGFQVSAADNANAIMILDGDNSLLELKKTNGTLSGGASRSGATIKLHHEAQWESGYSNNPSASTNDYLGGIEFSTGDDSTGQGVRAAIRATVDSYYNQNSIVMETAPGATAADPIERMRVLHNGNVGIGTSNPDGKLTVALENSNTPAFRLSSPTSGTDFAISSYNDANGTYVSMGVNHLFDVSGNDAVMDTNDKSAAIVLDGRNNGRIQFLTNSSGIATPRMTISSSGKIGINTLPLADTTGTLHVGGGLSVGAGNHAGYHVFSQHEGNVPSNTTRDVLQFEGPAYARYMTVTISGYLCRKEQYFSGYQSWDGASNGNNVGSTVNGTTTFSNGTNSSDSRAKIQLECSAVSGTSGHPRYKLKLITGGVSGQLYDTTIVVKFYNPPFYPTYL